VLTWFHRHLAALAAIFLLAAGLSYVLCEHEADEADSHECECVCLCHAQIAPHADSQLVPPASIGSRCWIVAVPRCAQLIAPDIFRPPIA
jgi:hypothetical protein